MGQTLSEPVTNKDSGSGEDGRYYYGVSSMQGWRVSMEDAHSVVLDMAPESDRRIAWFAVFDGHGGKTQSHSYFFFFPFFFPGGDIDFRGV
jgi:protein phosphatase PTC2/3